MAFLANGIRSSAGRWPRNGAARMPLFDAFGLRETRTADLEQVAVEQGDPDPDQSAYI